MFLPWKSGNWKGALQQWLACLLIILTIMALMSISGIFFIPVYYYCAWSTWFALTQRERIALPAYNCGCPFGCLLSIVGFIILIFMHPWSLWALYNPYISFPLLCLPAFGCLCTSCFVIEHRVPVILLGLVQMALGLCVILMFSSTLVSFVVYASIEGDVAWILLSIVAIFFVILFNLPNLYVGACLFMIGWQGDKESSQCSPEPAADGGWIGPCGTRNAASSRFCTGCGTPKPEQPGALEHKVGKQAEYPTIEKGEVMA
jgi:hypothetical protein